MDQPDKEHGNLHIRFRSHRNAAVLLLLFLKYGFGHALWESLFQAVSAFNNAGFDLFGNFSSMTDYQHNAFLLLTTAVLAILGGISYIAVADVFIRRRLSYLALDTKIVLTTTATLLLLGTAVRIG
ncbi:MAG: hypothetical protein D4R38_00520 [Dehalococcoidia bacterium]|nr:MAG: hypothetical protein D4R38_00520 [Dehalococcoidia bacterium]